MRIFHKLCAVSVIAFAMLVFANGQTAEGAFKLKLTSSAGGSTEVEDNLAGDESGITGVITVGNDAVLSVGGFEVILTASLSNQTAGDPFLSELDLQVLKITNVSAGDGATLTILTTDTDFALSPPAGNYILSSQLTGPVVLPDGSSVTGQAFVDLANSEYGKSITNGLITAIGGTAPDLVFSGVSPFSGTLEQKVTLNEGDNIVSTDLNLRVVTPEPASVALILSSLPAFAGGFYYLRRRRKKSQSLAA